MPGPENQVPQEVVGGHVGGTHGGVVRTGANLRPDGAKVAVLVDLANGEGKGREAVPQWRLA